MRLIIKKWGNSAGLPLSKPLLEQLGAGIGGVVSIEVKNGGIFIKPVHEDLTLEQLIEGSPREKLEKNAEDREWLDDRPRGKESL